LQALAGFLQSRLAHAGREQQRGQEAHNQKWRYCGIPPAQAIQRFPQDVHMIHFVNKIISCPALSL
jgi:hypothetical protein